MKDISRELLEKEINDLLTETFDKAAGIYLDRGTSLFETFGQIDAVTASQPAVAGGTSIAGHVEHMRWYLEITEGFIKGETYKGFDWNTTWQVKEVSDDEWKVLVQSLRTAWDSFRTFMSEFEDWDENRLGGALGVIAHNAYHLGAIRQILKAAKAS